MERKLTIYANMEQTSTISEPLHKYLKEKGFIPEDVSVDQMTIPSSYGKVEETINFRLGKRRIGVVINSPDEERVNDLGNKLKETMKGVGIKVK